MQRNSVPKYEHGQISSTFMPNIRMDSKGIDSW